MICIRKLTAALALSLAATFLACSAAWADDNSPNPEKERELLAVLRSEASAAEKAIACKFLAVHGTDAAVPELAKLLVNEQLASWARIPLEVIPGTSASDALRKALDSTQGLLQVGVINSIGVRRDPEAVEGLAARLGDADPEIAVAAAVALGKIGNSPATKSLQAALKSNSEKHRSGAAQGLILCAERLAAEDKGDAAAALYDEVRKADVPKQRVIEASRGAILARKDAGVPLLIELLGSSDKSLMQVALGTAREIPGNKIDEALAAHVAKAEPDRAALIIAAMADRPGTVVLPAVMKAATKGDKRVRLAAVSALSRVGNASCLTALLEVVLDADADLSGAAKGALADLQGDGVDKEIVSRLAKPEGKMYAVLLDLVGERRIEATSALLKAVDHSDKTVRASAFTALGKTVPMKSLDVLVTKAVAPKHADDATVAQAALKTACIRMPDRDACCDQLALGMEKAPAGTKTILLEIMGDVGGAKALKLLAAAAKGNDAQLQDAGSRVLGKWGSLDAAPVLLDLAKTTADNKYQSRAIRGYIGLVRRFKTISEQQRIEMCQTALATCRNAADKKLVLDVLKLNPSIEGLKLTIKTSEDVAELKDDGTQAALSIAQALSAKKDEVAPLLANLSLAKVKLEIVKAEYGSGAVQRDVTDAVKKFAADVQFVSLGSGNYNDVFGGDPAPNTVKQLKIRYSINGVAGEAAFPENALIVLPMPKAK